MFRRTRRTSYIRQLALLSAMPLALTGVGYALFSQNLNLAANTEKPAYTSSQYVYATYTKTETPSGSNTAYSFNPVTITNKGATSITAWQLKFDVPSNVATVTCASTVTCTKSGVTVTVKNGTGNGTIAAGASTTFTMSFTSATAKYTLQNMVVSGTFSTTNQTIAGLSVALIKVSGTKAGATWTYKYTFTVTNATAQSLSAWQAACTWSSAATSSTVDTTVSFSSNASRINFMSKTALAATSNFTFNGTFTKNSSTWVVRNCTITGRA